MADLSLYNYEVCHIPGSTNTAADALSRMPFWKFRCHRTGLMPIRQIPLFWSSVISWMDNLKRTGDSHGMAAVCGLETVSWSQSRNTMLSSPSSISPWWPVIGVYPELPPCCNSTLLCIVYVTLSYNTCVPALAASLPRWNIPKLEGCYNP